MARQPDSCRDRCTPGTAYPGIAGPLRGLRHYRRVCARRTFSRAAGPNAVALPTATVAVARAVGDRGRRRAGRANAVGRGSRRAARGARQRDAARRASSEPPTSARTPPSASFDRFCYVPKPGVFGTPTFRTFLTFHNLEFLERPGAEVPRQTKPAGGFASRLERFGARHAGHPGGLGGPGCQGITSWASAANVVVIHCIRDRQAIGTQCLMEAASSRECESDESKCASPARPRIIQNRHAIIRP
jgi:hypothetical protein